MSGADEVSADHGPRSRPRASGRVGLGNHVVGKRTLRPSLPPFPGWPPWASLPSGGEALTSALRRRAAGRGSPARPQRSARPVATARAARPSQTPGLPAASVSVAVLEYVRSVRRTSSALPARGARPVDGVVGRGCAGAGGWFIPRPKGQQLVLHTGRSALSCESRPSARGLEPSRRSGCR